jgi:hypothetical protein
LALLSALGLCSAACSSTSPGAAGDAGGVSEGGAEAAPAACSEFTPCGGDLVGTWASDHACTPTTISQVDGCQGETFDATAVVSTTTWTFRAGGTMTIALSAAGPTTVQVTDACLTKRGAGKPVTCTDASAGALYASEILFQGGKASASTCQPGANGICNCTVTFVADPRSLEGTYSVAGTAVTANLGGDQVTSDYCVSGATLKMRTRPTTVNTPPMLGVFLRQ